jgi:membrane protease YdiL (CAAX protease family)
LLLPLVLAYGTALPRTLPLATLPIVVGSAAIALVNGVGEEVLWRGLYLRSFPGQAWLSLFWPAVGFAVWHFAPQSIRANTMSGGAVSLVLVAGVVGLLWAWVARQSGSLRWVAAAHVLFDFAGLGAVVYLGPTALT